MASFLREAFLRKRLVCCALTIVYSIYNAVGRSIASKYNLGGIFTSGRIYRLWTSLPYYIYDIAIGQFNTVQGVFSTSETLY